MVEALRISRAGQVAISRQHRGEFIGEIVRLKHDRRMDASAGGRLLAALRRPQSKPKKTPETLISYAITGSALKNNRNPNPLGMESLR